MSYDSTGICISVTCAGLTLSHSKQPKLHTVLAVLSATGLKDTNHQTSMIVNHSIHFFTLICTTSNRGRGSDDNGSATWSGGAGVLPKLSVPGRPANLNSRARAYCACSRCWWGFVWTFFPLSVFSLFFFPLWEMARYRLKYCLKRLLNPKQPTLRFCKTAAEDTIFFSLLSFEENQA